jgi:hypothetical protein
MNIIIFCQNDIATENVYIHPSIQFPNNILQLTNIQNTGYIYI